MSGKAVVTLACLARMQKATIAMNTLFFLMAPAASIFWQLCIYTIYIFICITVERELTLSSNWEVCLADGCHCCCWCSWIAHFSAGRASRDWADYWDCCACTVPLLVHLLAHFFIFLRWPSNLILQQQSFPPVCHSLYFQGLFYKVSLRMLLTYKSN